MTHHNPAGTRQPTPPVTQVWVTLLDYHYQPLTTRLVHLLPDDSTVWSLDAEEKRLLRKAWRVKLEHDPKRVIHQR
jgi:hypothetical protein